MPSCCSFGNARLGLSSGSDMSSGRGGKDSPRRAKEMKGLPSMGLEAAGIYEISVSEHSHGLVSKQRTPKSNKWCSVFPLFICLSVCLSLPVSVCLCLSLSVSVCLFVTHIYPSIKSSPIYLSIHPSVRSEPQNSSQVSGEWPRAPWPGQISARPRRSEGWQATRA